MSGINGDVRPQDILAAGRMNRDTDADYGRFRLHDHQEVMPYV